MFKVLNLDDSSENQRLWGDFMQSSTDATLDHCWEWRRVLQGAFGFEPYYLGAFTGNRLCGILPLFHVPRGFGRSALVSIPFGNYGGICAESQEAALGLFKEAKRIVEKLKCGHLALYHKTTPLDSGELETVDDRSQFSMRINGSPDVHFVNLTSELRRQIRYGAKHGLTIGLSRDTGPLYEIHTDKYRRLGTPCFPKEYFDLTLKYFGERAEIKYAYYKNKAVAFDLIHYYRSALLITMGGDLADCLKLKPNVCLFWDQVKTAAKLGFEEVDMCRSKRGSGAANFKKRLGIQEQRLNYQYYVPKGKKLERRDPRDSKFQIASRMWRTMPLSCTKYLGPKLVRYFA